MIPQRRSALLSAPLRPTWSWDFTRGALPSGATFSRTSAATQFDAAGTLCWAPENRITWSQDFSQAIWGKYAGGTGSVPVVTQNDSATLAPDETQTAAKVVFACGGGTTPSDQSILLYTGGSNSVVIGRPYTGFLRVKAAAGTQLVFRHVGVVSYTLFTATGGWDTLTADEVAGGIQLNFEIGIRQGLVGTINAGATVWVWGAQVHGKPNADPTYHPTAGGFFYGCRFDHDPQTGAPLGYLAEMQSTNMIAQSSALTASGWSATHVTLADNQVVSPDGTATAATAIEDATTNQHEFEYITVNIVSGTNYGFSLFVKNVSGTRWIQPNIAGGTGFNFQPSTGTLGAAVGSNPPTNLVARAMANGWWRISGQFQANATGSTSFRVYFTQGAGTGAGVSFAGDGTSGFAVWGVQCEAGGVGVTSYIPTGGAAATRSADSLAMPLSAVPGWNGSTGGAFAAAGRLYTVYPPLPGFNQMPVWINNAGDYRNSVGVEFDNGGSGQRGVFMFSGGAGASIGSNFGAVPAAFVRSRMTVGWQANRIAAAYDGANRFVQTGTQALPAGPTTLNIGLYLGSHAFGGAIDSIAYYAGTRPDALVQRASR